MAQQLLNNGVYVRFNTNNKRFYMMRQLYKVGQTRDIVEGKYCNIDGGSLIDNEWYLTYHSQDSVEKHNQHNSQTKTSAIVFDDRRVLFAQDQSKIDDYARINESNQAYYQPNWVDMGTQNVANDPIKSAAALYNVKPSVLYSYQTTCIEYIPLTTKLIDEEFDMVIVDHEDTPIAKWCHLEQNSDGHIYGNTTQSIRMTYDYAGDMGIYVFIPMSGLGGIKGQPYTNAMWIKYIASILPNEFSTIPQVFTMVAQYILIMEWESEYKKWLSAM